MEVVEMNNQESGSPARVHRLNASTGSETILVIGPKNVLDSMCSLHSSQFELWGFTSEGLNSTDVISLSAELARSIDAAGIKRLTLVGAEWGGPVVIHYASENLKNIRRVVFLDALSRPRQLFAERLIEQIEKVLPLGLPFRPLSRAFDPRPIIHRVRCPALILTTISNKSENDQDTHLLDFHAQFLSERLPNAWRRSIQPQALQDNLESFVSVSTKKPQKNFGRETGGE